MITHTAEIHKKSQNDPCLDVIDRFSTYAPNHAHSRDTFRSYTEREAKYFIESQMKTSRYARHGRMMTMLPEAEVDRVLLA